MKHPMLKRFAALGLCCAAATTCAFAARVVTKNITVEYADIKLVVDGVQVTPKDANGAVVEPFVYNGTTYLPVRAVGNAISKEVAWDGTTKTVYIGDVPGQLNNKYLEPYQKYGAGVYSGNAAKSFSMMGKKYTQGITMNYEDYADYSLNGHYESVSFDVGHIDSSNSGAATLYVYADGEIVQQIELTGDMKTKHVEVKVDNALQMKLALEGGLAAYGVANIMGIE